MFECVESRASSRNVSAIVALEKLLSAALQSLLTPQYCRCRRLSVAFVLSLDILSDDDSSVLHGLHEMLSRVLSSRDTSALTQERREAGVVACA